MERSPRRHLSPARQLRQAHLCYGTPPRLLLCVSDVPARGVPRVPPPHIFQGGVCGTRSTFSPLPPSSPECVGDVPKPKLPRTTGGSCCRYFVTFGEGSFSIAVLWFQEVLARPRSSGLWMCENMQLHMWQESSQTDELWWSLRRTKRL